MPKALVNAVCSRCGHFKPRCAYVWPLAQGVWRANAVALCEECRKAQHGKFRLDDRHRS